jgi:outer membrane biosynthesis protein TonB
VKTKKFLPLFVLIILLISPYSIFLVKADVPSILELSTEDEGGETFLVILVRHRSPSSNHIVDEIQIRIEDKTETIVFESQSTVEFTERFKIDSISNEIQVRAHCNLHGWSTWKNADLPTPTPTPEPTPTPSPTPTPTPTQPPTSTPTPTPTPEPTHTPTPTPTPTPEQTPTPTPEPEKPKGIPGFPTSSILIGLTATAIFLWSTHRKK